MTITFINSDGAGFARLLDVPDGHTIDKLLAEQLPSRSASDYLIRVDRLPVTAEHVLIPGCRVSITPTKIAGAQAIKITAASAVEIINWRRSVFCPPTPRLAA
jgi:hypothetical protein